MLHVHIHVACPCSCCMFMSMLRAHVLLHVHVHAVCRMSLLHVYVNAAEQCECCISISMLHAQLPMSMNFHVHAACPRSYRSCSSCLSCMPTSVLHVSVNSACLCQFCTSMSSCSRSIYMFICCLFIIHVHFAYCKRPYFAHFFNFDAIFLCQINFSHTF
jgi:hypothetical protein